MKTSTKVVLVIGIILVIWITMACVGFNVVPTYKTTEITVDGKVTNQKNFELGNPWKPENNK